MEQATQQFYQWDLSAVDEGRKKDLEEALAQADINMDVDEAMQLSLEEFVSDVKRYMENPEEAEQELEERNTNINIRNLIKGVALAQTDPPKARQFLYEGWLGSSELLFRAMLMPPSMISPAARRLISEVLHFGPHADWNSSIAYSAEQDNLIQSCLVNLKSPSLTADMLREYAQKYPNCGMFKVLEGLLYIRTSASMTGCKLLLDGYDMGIPEKYKYFIVNYINTEVLSWVKNVDSPSRERVRASGFLLVFVYKLFPTEENKSLIVAFVSGANLSGKVYIPCDKCFSLHYMYDIHSNTPSGCCVWLVLGFAAVSAVGGGLYWLQTLI